VGPVRADAQVLAFAKALEGAGIGLPRCGKVMLSVRDVDKQRVLRVARDLDALGFELYGTHGTADYIRDAGVACTGVNKVSEGRPHIVDMIKNDEISLIVNTTEGRQAIRESQSIRREAVHRKVTYYTTLAAARATCVALEYLDVGDVHRLTDLHEELTA